MCVKCWDNLCLYLSHKSGRLQIKRSHSMNKGAITDQSCLLSCFLSNLHKSNKLPTSDRSLVIQWTSWRLRGDFPLFLPCKIKNEQISHLLLVSGLLMWLTVYHSGRGTRRGLVHRWRGYRPVCDRSFSADSLLESNEHRANDPPTPCKCNCGCVLDDGSPKV